MTDEAKLYRCMGGNRCNHVPGTCTATNTEYQAKAKEKQSMTDDHNGPEQTFRDTERNLRNLIETQAREIERLNTILSAMNDTDVIARTMADLAKYKALAETLAWALGEAVTWNSHDDEGVAAVWLDQADEALRQYKEATNV